MSKSSRDKVRITAEIPKKLSKQIDREAARIKKAGGKGTRSEAVTEVIRRHFLGTHGGNSALMAAYGEVRREAARLKVYALELAKEGHVLAAKRSCLLSASKELEALALLVEPEENVVAGTVIETLMLLKEGVGYRHLPDVPSGRSPEIASA